MMLVIVTPLVSYALLILSSCLMQFAIEAQHTKSSISSRSCVYTGCYTSNKLRCQLSSVIVPPTPSLLSFITPMKRKTSTATMMINKKPSVEIYNIPGSGWTSSSWNWGYANGTGHDCALICRRKFSTKQKRKELIRDLIHPVCINSNSDTGNGREDGDTIRCPPFEEVKLILGLTIQRGKWDGTDGGRNGGYSEVLQYMAQAERYESNDEELNSRLFVKDLSDRFHLIAGNTFEEGDSESENENVPTENMQQIINQCSDDYDILRRKITGLVLQKMGFIEIGM